MNRIVILLALLLPLTATASANELKAHGGPASAQVQALPADASQWYVSVMGNPSDPEFQKLTRWFKTDPNLSKLAAKTHYSAIPATSKLYQARYAATVPKLPCVRIQAPTGKVLCQLSGDNIPVSSAACWRALRHHSYRCQPQTQPQPNIHYHIHKQEKPAPDPVPDSAPFDDTVVDETDEPSGDAPWEAPIWLICLLGAVALAVGVGVEWKRSS